MRSAHTMRAAYQGNGRSQCTWIAQVQEHCLLPLDRLGNLVTHRTQDTQRAGLSSGDTQAPAERCCHPASKHGKQDREPGGSG